MYNISKLLNVNFLILHEGHKTQEGRSGLVAYKNASTFIIANSYDKWEVMPLFIFYRVLSTDKTHDVYSIFIDKDNNIAYFDYGNMVSSHIKNLVLLHVKAKQKP